MERESVREEIVTEKRREVKFNGEKMVREGVDGSESMWWLVGEWGKIYSMGSL